MRSALPPLLLLVLAGLSHAAPTVLLAALQQGQRSVVGDTGGQWTHCTHLHVYGINFNAGLARFLAHMLQPSSVLEFGCGLGLYVDYIARTTQANPVYGIEPEPMVFPQAIFKTINDRTARPAQLAVNVLDEGVTLNAHDLARRFDLVFSIEVAEHIPAHLHRDLVDFLVARTGKYLVFSAARPGQEGVGHISPVERSEWLRRFETAGLKYMVELTRAAQRLSDRKNINHRQNLLVFARPENGAEDTSVPPPRALLERKEDDPTVLWPQLTKLATDIRAGTVKCQQLS